MEIDQPTRGGGDTLGPPVSEEVAPAGPAAVLLARLEMVEDRLNDLAASEDPIGRDPGGRAAPVTSPDPATGEQWEAGQAWAHVAEFVPYWLGEIRRVIAGDGSSAVHFGRTKSDPQRIAAIERDRHESPATLMQRTTDGIAELRALLEGLDAGAWELRGRHPTLGELDVGRIVDRFLVAHLEEHAEQLEQLRPDETATV